jgi:hypothetical protein
VKKLGLFACVELLVAAAMMPGRASSHREAQLLRIDGPRRMGSVRELSARLRVPRNNPGWLEPVAC